MRFLTRLKECSLHAASIVTILKQVESFKNYDVSNMTARTVSSRICQKFLHSRSFSLHSHPTRTFSLQVLSSPIHQASSTIRAFTGEVSLTGNPVIRASTTKGFTITESDFEAPVVRASIVRHSCVRTAMMIGSPLRQSTIQALPGMHLSSVPILGSVGKSPFSSGPLRSLSLPCLVTHNKRMTGCNAVSATDGVQVLSSRHLSLLAVRSPSPGSNLSALQQPWHELTRINGASAATWQHVRGFSSKMKPKKTKIKPYSSWKRRFKLLANGEFKRWREGKRHNASLKSPKQRRQLRRPSIVFSGLKQPMIKLGFTGQT
eukprot:TRINITY_DN2163_c0_g1_i1.p1 TRINITY_DN2163_c0_g1~~TRINITY_DN2163_c0_g1_i1.p1  ORF type:complete len:318 (+),score=7.63 TRINITY_DN2163_c0_g1_i1:351-1304(+)